MLVILGEQKLNLGKIENFKWSINPYSTTVLIQGRQNHIVLQTLYLKNSREFDRKVQGFFKEEEISYDMSKFELTMTFPAHIAST